MKSKPWSVILNPPDGWTASGGFITSEFVNPLFGLKSGSWDSDALGQTLDSQLIALSPEFSGAMGQSCQAEIIYKAPGIASGDYKFQVVDQVPTVLATVDLEPTTGDETIKTKVSFACQYLLSSMILCVWLVLGAMPEELFATKNKIKSVKTKKNGPITLYYLHSNKDLLKSLPSPLNLSSRVPVIIRTGDLMDLQFESSTWSVECSKWKKVGLYMK